MKAASLSEARSDLVKSRVLEGVAQVLGRRQALTYANVAEAAGVPERTLYRHFPTRELLLRAVFDWSNMRIGFRGELPKDGSEVAALARRVFPGFDEIAPVIVELLIAPEGRLARLAEKSARQRASLAVVRHELGSSDSASGRRLAALLQLLTTAATWQTLRDYWDMDGAEAAETVALAVELLLEGARAQAARSKGRKQAKRAKKSKPTKETGA